MTTEDMSPARFQQLNMTEKDNFIEHLIEMLRHKEPRVLRPSEISYIHAAVLVPLYQNDSGYQVLFTERTHTVAHHKGQISFPGGTVEDRDSSYVETALRETCEEIGLLPEDVEVLGQLDDETTLASRFIVHPFVGLIPHPYEYIINRAEVEQIIPVPLEKFLVDEPGFRCSAIDFDEFTYQGTAYLHQGDVIWGATARIMDRLTTEIQAKIPLHALRD